MPSVETKARSAYIAAMRDFTVVNRQLIQLHYQSQTWACSHRDFDLFDPIWVQFHEDLHKTDKKLQTLEERMSVAHVKWLKAYKATKTKRDAEKPVEWLSKCWQSLFASKKRS
ncbi:hypothetical protein Ae201684_014046 [Aphanomyces euteiches]|uniref:Uncharacterized protein n=1 Tax=Aphanomyces euteiches TaxID=100861 RepID=A0A6G0WL65_9STRA|nr:hypothetical protein Ae201684_014046 [Aphanomyces euteiches]KAH9153422.1 hypothetical protein AeRB84_004327 [Aphanomyces euteiches]